MIRLAIRVRRRDAEIVLAQLLALAPSGVEERDLADGVVEYAVYGAAGELPDLPDVRAAAGGALVDVTTEAIADDWHERWREFHRPVDAGPVHVRAPWHPRPAGGRGVVEIVIDPGQAFGTGAHDTTRLSLELLATLQPAGACVDVGCGSGVLGIAAAKLGWGPVLGLDHDAEAVCATRENAAVNGVAVQARRHDLLHDGPAPGAPLVLANLLAPLLLRVAQDGFTAFASQGPGTAAGGRPRWLVASGLLPAEADTVAEAFAAHQGLRERARRATGEWCALLLEGAPDARRPPFRAAATSR